MTDTAKKVIEIASKLSGVQADPDSRLLEDLDLDSLDRIEMAIELERAFDIDIPDEDVDNAELGTVNGLIKYIDGRVLA